MKIKTVLDVLGKEYEVEKMDNYSQYIFTFKDKQYGALSMYFKGDELLKMLFQGKESEKIRKLFENIVDKDKLV